MNAREQIIFDAFNDPAQGFISASRLYRKLRDEHPNAGFTAGPKAARVPVQDWGPGACAQGGGIQRPIAENERNENVY